MIAIGEIRDKTTAEIALQAALTGHLILTTFHAGSACEVIGRFLDMGIEPYVVRSGLRAVVAQRLVRRLCENCSTLSTRDDDFLGLPIQSARVPAGCAHCRDTGYQGGTLLAEILIPDRAAVAQAILARADVTILEHAATLGGMVPLWRRTIDAVEAGHTSPGEIRRVLGVSSPAKPDSRPIPP